MAANECNFHIFLGPWSKQTPCDKAKDFLGKAGLSFESKAAPAGETVITTIGNTQIRGWDEAKYKAALTTTGYPAKADLTQVNWVMAELILVIMLIYVTMVYGPIAAFLVELFPTKIRYTSMSVPYHFGNGWFGGFLPLIAMALTTSTWAKETFGSGAQYTGLIYPIGVCIVTLIVGGLFIHETKDHKIDADLHVRT